MENYFLQQSLSILEAAKLDEVSRSQDLVSCLNRGGLWSICTATENRKCV